MNLWKDLIYMSRHSGERFLQRSVPMEDVNEFWTKIKNDLCVIVYACVINGNVDGSSRRYKFGSTYFVVTFDTIRNKLVIKTMLGA